MLGCTETGVQRGIMGYADAAGFTGGLTDPHAVEHESSRRQTDFLSKPGWFYSVACEQRCC